MFPWDVGYESWFQKNTRILGLLDSGNYIILLLGFAALPTCNGQTDRRMDMQPVAKSTVEHNKTTHKHNINNKATSSSYLSSLFEYSMR